MNWSNKLFVQKASYRYYKYALCFVDEYNVYENERVTPGGGPSLLIDVLMLIIIMITANVLVIPILSISRINKSVSIV